MEITIKLINYPHGIPMSRIVREIGCTNTAIYNQIKLLEKAGVIKTEISGRERKSMLTPAGEKIANSLFEIEKNTNRKLFKGQIFRNS